MTTEAYIMGEILPLLHRPVGRHTVMQMIGSKSESGGSHASQRASAQSAALLVRRALSVDVGIDELMA